jgi:hypothetical protein
MDVRFGKRLVSEARDKSPSVAATLAVAAKPIGIPAIQSAPPAPQPAPEPQRSDDYYVTKSMIFGALVEAIDLSQLSRLDAENAREEIRDIVHEIVAIKNVAVSIGEQEDLIDDICNDVLGYGPLEPLLGRDDIADIMVNGATRTFIEVGGKIQLTNIRFRDNAQLMNVCQRIVSQVGRRVDDASPICDARLADGSRVNVIAPPLAIDGPVLTIRKFRKDKLTLDQLIRSGSISPEGGEILKIIGRVRCNVLISGGTGSGKTTLLNCQLHRYRRARDYLRGCGRTPIAATACGPPRNEAGEHRRQRRDYNARSRQELPAHAARTDHRRRGPRSGGFRPFAGDEHRSRRFDGHPARQFAARGAKPPRIHDYHGWLRAAAEDSSGNDRYLYRCHRPGGKAS